MSSWCWSKEPVLPFFPFLLLPRCPLLVHVSQTVLERDTFPQRAETKGSSMILPCFCPLPLQAKGASIAAFVRARQLIQNMWSLPWGGGGGAGDSKGATPEADASIQRVVFEPVVSTPRRMCYLNFPCGVLNTTHSTRMVYWLIQYEPINSWDLPV